MSLFTRSLRQRSKENEHTERDATPEERDSETAASGDTANAEAGSGAGREARDGAGTESSSAPGAGTRADTKELAEAFGTETDAEPATPAGTRTEADAESAAEAEISEAGTGTETDAEHPESPETAETPSGADTEPAEAPAEPETSEARSGTETADTETGTGESATEPAAPADTDKPAAPDAAAAKPPAPAAAHADGGGTGTGEGEGDENDGGKGGGGEPARGWRERHPAAARTASVTATVLAAALVLAALLLPNALTRLTPNAFLRIPLTGIFGAIALVILPPRTRNWAALTAGSGLGLLTILKCIDMGFYSVLARPFDLVLDWILFDDAMSFLEDTLGSTGAVAGLAGIVVLALALVVFMALAVRRLARLLARRSVATIRTAVALGTVWVVCAVFSVQTGADHVDVASRNNILLLENRVDAFNAGIKDAKEFKKQARVDRFDDTPADKLMPALRGKNVIFTFVESYGRSAIEDPEIAPGVNSVLRERTKALDKAGFSSRSGWLTSPISGAGSWMGHSTLMSGLWVANQQRYRSVTSSDRMTLVRAFRKTGDYRMVGIMPGVTRSWPEGKFYGMDHVYDSRELGYKGPKFSWSPVPDQFSLKAFEKLEHGKAGHKPMMATIILASSHNPWSPLPVMLPWNKLGDGSVYQGIHDRGAKPTEVWKDPHRVREQYGKAIQYSVRSLTEYVEKYGDDDTVLVFLGDHQPVPTVTGGRNASKDVPISIVAHDDKVLEKISDWGWDKGLKPSHKAPVWRMDKFRDHFMTAYGSEPEPGAEPAPAPRPQR